MLYLLKTKLPKHKSIFFALTNIYGINKNIAFSLCKKLGFSVNLKTKNLTDKQISKLLQLIESLNLMLNNDLKKMKSLILKNLVLKKSYRGLRSIYGLPVRGQRTHTNAKISKKRFKNL